MANNLTRQHPARPHFDFDAALIALLFVAQLAVAAMGATDAVASPPSVASVAAAHVHAAP